VIRVVVAGMGAGEQAEQESTGLATALRNAGMEAIFSGWGQGPEQVVRGAVQEDADAIGLCGGSAGLLEQVRALLAEEQAAEVLVFVFGAAPDSDGEAAFASGAAPEAVAHWVRSRLTAGQP